LLQKPYGPRGAEAVEQPLREPPHSPA
jgi:hypothetical protein